MQKIASSHPLQQSRWSGFAWRSFSAQALFLGFAGFLLVEAFLNGRANMQAHNIPTDFAFLNKLSGFDINQTLISYSAASTYARAFWVGLINTLIVASLGLVFATLLGFSIGIARLSQNLAIAKLALAYVELVRNVPLLLQLLFWYNAVLKPLPPPESSIALPGGVFLNNRGFVLPDLTSLPLVTPRLGHFNFETGWHIRPEFIALLLGLSFYTASFIAEIVRAGIISVPEGLTEAASALGLRPFQSLRLITLPLALRVIIPPLTSQYVNLVKNSSLAVFIGYPDLVQVFAGTVLNQTGAAVQVMGITMAVYLALSLTISAAMNIFNSRVAPPERAR